MQPLPNDGTAEEGGEVRIRDTFSGQRASRPLNLYPSSKTFSPSSISFLQELAVKQTSMGHGMRGLGGLYHSRMRKVQVIVPQWLSYAMDTCSLAAEDLGFTWVHTTRPQKT